MRVVKKDEEEKKNFPRPEIPKNLDAVGVKEDAFEKFF